MGTSDRSPSQRTGGLRADGWRLNPFLANSGRFLDQPRKEVMATRFWTRARCYRFGGNWPVYLEG